MSKADAVGATAQSPLLERGDIIEVELVAWGRLGEAMGRWGGRDVFVFGGIPGERVAAEVVAIRRKYVAAQVTRVIVSAPERVTPPCSYFGECTGCQWQHIRYEAQLAAKTGMVRDALERVGRFHLPAVLPSADRDAEHHSPPAGGDAEHHSPPAGGDAEHHSPPAGGDAEYHLPPAGGDAEYHLPSPGGDAAHHSPADAGRGVLPGASQDESERVGRFHNPSGQGMTPATERRRKPVVLGMMGAPEEYGYRNHGRFNVWRSSGALGFTHRERRRFVAIERCLLMQDGVNALLAELQGKCGETSQVAIRASDGTGDYLVQPALRNPAVGIATGQKRYRESVAGREFWVASPSFFQVNVKQAARLAELVRDGLGLSGRETVVDAYAGVGTFAVLLAQDAGEVIAIEESTAAVADAEANAAGLGNVRFLTGKVEEVLPGLAVKPDAVILDPSRSGCQGAVLEALLRLAPGRIAYVSCNPETLARDLAVLCRGYAVEWVQPVDMFPQTHHIECVAILARKAAGAVVTLASASPRRRELLGDLGIEFRVAPSNIPEEQGDGETPDGMVRRLSREKALAVAESEGATSGYYIGADSTVVLEGEAIAKPADAAEARAMLTRLRGTAHQVVTGLTVFDAATGRCLTEAVAADVVMRQFTDAEMERSIASGTPMDKAGAYAIQDADFRPARLERGCYANVMGLPVCRVTALLAEVGCPLPDLGGMTAPAGCTTADCPFNEYGDGDGNTGGAR